MYMHLSIIVTTEVNWSKKGKTETDRSNQTIGKPLTKAKKLFCPEADIMTHAVLLWVTFPLR